MNNRKAALDQFNRSNQSRVILIEKSLETPRILK